MKQKINPDGMIKPPAPYSTIIKISGVEEMICLSGVSANGPEGGIVGKGDILEQARQIVENIKQELAAVGASEKDIVMTTTYVLGDSMDDFLMTGAAKVLFDGLDNPADTLVGVASLAGMKGGALIEVSAIAVKD